MADAVVHFEILGSDPAALRRFYSGVFGWHYVGDPNQEGEGGFVEGSATGDGTGINGNVGGAERPAARFYVGVADVGAALMTAQRLGGTVVMGPEGTPGEFMSGHFRDPEGNLIGVAGTR